jgi:hypothetical protein
MFVGLFMREMMGRKVQFSRCDRMPRKQCNLPVEVRRGELSVHPASEDPVLRGDSQDRVDRENSLKGGLQTHRPYHQGTHRAS